MNLKDHLLVTQDFPKPGVTFQDLSKIFANDAMFFSLIDKMAVDLISVDVIIGIESRGMPLAAAIAARYNKGYAAIRKEGKVPGDEKFTTSYRCEYGIGRLEFDPTCIPEDSRVLLVDDVLATGGTASAAINLLGSCPTIAEVAGVSFALEIEALNGIKELEQFGVPCYSAIKV